MGWLDRLLGRGSSPSAALPAPASIPTPDGAAFERLGSDGAGQFGRAGSLATGQALALAYTSLGRVSEQTPPDEVPYELLEAMRFDPWIYIGERMFAAPLQDPTLYFVEHPDPAIQAETEAWLRKLLPALLREITRAFALGSAPYVLDWEATDLAFSVRRAGADPFVRRRPGHQHFAEAVHRIRPVEASIVHGGDRLLEPGPRLDVAAGRVEDFRHLAPQPGPPWFARSSRRRPWSDEWRRACAA